MSGKRMHTISPLDIFQKGTADSKDEFHSHCGKTCSIPSPHESYTYVPCVSGGLTVARILKKIFFKP